MKRKLNKSALNSSLHTSKPPKNTRTQSTKRPTCGCKVSEEYEGLPVISAKNLGKVNGLKEIQKEKSYQQKTPQGKVIKTNNNKIIKKKEQSSLITHMINIYHRIQRKIIGDRNNQA